MTMEKSFNDFMKLHGRKLMTKDIDVLENDVISAVNRASSLLGTEGGEELDEAVANLRNGLEAFQKVLIKHDMYEL